MHVFLVVIGLRGPFDHKAAVFDVLLQIIYNFLHRRVLYFNFTALIRQLLISGFCLV